MATITKTLYVKYRIEKFPMELYNGYFTGCVSQIGGTISGEGIHSGVKTEKDTISFIIEVHKKDEKGLIAWIKQYLKTNS